MEPNSGLGQAITYMLKHWERLSLFLRQEGAPLHNNFCEASLKQDILHRRTACSIRHWPGRGLATPSCGKDTVQYGGSRVEVANP